MSHVIEEYAKCCGVTIGTPIIKEHFFPLIHEKYITLDVDFEDESSFYNHWDIVLHILKPFLEKENIKIIQITKKEGNKLALADDLIKNVSYKNLFYIIKNSLAHLGLNNLPSHIASSYDKKNVTLFGDCYIETCKPYWSTNGTATNLSPDFSKEKPTFSESVTSKRINEIKPEVIVSSLLKLLKIKHNIQYDTVYYGSSYTQEHNEVIPSEEPLQIRSKNKIHVRLDKNHQPNFLHHFFSSGVQFRLTISKPIPSNFLIKNNIKKLHYISDEFDSAFIKDLKKSGIEYSLYCTSKKKIKRQRLKFFYDEIQPYIKKDIVKFAKKQIGKVDFDKILFSSNRKIYYKGQVFDSYYRISNKKDDFFIDLPHLMCYYHKHDE